MAEHRPRAGWIRGLVLLSLIGGTCCTNAAGIDRQALVSRNSPLVTRVDFDSALTVGNGGFAFTVDATGLQSFPDLYHSGGTPTETMARWAWVEDENPEGYRLSDAEALYRHADGRRRPYPTVATSPAGQWLRRNPRTQPLGQLALDWQKPGGGRFAPSDIERLEQRLDLWEGVITSRYRLRGQPVSVETAVLPDSDTILVRIVSDLVASGELGVRVAFPRGYDPAIPHTPGFDWSRPDSHASTLQGRRRIRRLVTGLEYFLDLDRPATATEEPHTFRVRGEPGDGALSLAIRFGTQPQSASSPDFQRVAEHWRAFWRRSAAADFSGCTNPLAAELERRIVLSQYLTAVQMAAEMPPQESGLTCSTWFGKHHTEMIWWHAAHFALWGHPELLSKNLDWYVKQLPEARRLAASRDLSGARWAKMVGPGLRESPGGNPLIVWNQPHPIVLSELLHRDAPDSKSIGHYGELVQATAEGMASMLHFDASRNRYVLGPPLWIAQEIEDPATSQNPAFELAYWRWGLETAQRWRERRGLARDPQWEAMLQKLSPLPQDGGRYVSLESTPDTWRRRAGRQDHPSMLMALGVLPKSPLVDELVMQSTLDAVLTSWDWEAKIWGWDYPMIAMTAARLGRPETAVEVLLREGPNNRYLPNGHCPQRTRPRVEPGKPRHELAAYLPANGALLSAAALMIAGWDGAENAHPGFPKDGSWNLRSEGWRRLP